MSRSKRPGSAANGKWSPYRSRLFSLFTMQSLHHKTLPAISQRAPLAPPLKWVGGKRWLLPYIESLIAPHRHRRVVEPFAGGIAITLAFQPDHALVNDVNPHLINFYQWVKRGLCEEVAFGNNEHQYYTARERFNQLFTEGLHRSSEAAILFYYLNRTGFNGLCRFNSSGRFNVPFGRYRSIGYRSDFSEYRCAFRRWSFVSQDFASLQMQADDLIYADPPYDVPFTQYSKGGFSWKDQVRTAEWAAAHPGPVIVSNQVTDRIVTLYRTLGFTLRFLDAPRMISCTGDRSTAREALATRNI